MISQQVNIGSGNGLVLSGNKPLPEPILTQISVAIQWGQNELSMNYCLLIDSKSLPLLLVR